MKPTEEEMSRLVQQVGIHWCLEQMKGDCAFTPTELLQMECVYVNGQKVGDSQIHHNGTCKPGDVIEIVTKRMVLK